MISVGEFIDTERYKKNITREELTKGICSPQWIQQAQRGGYDVDVLLFEILMERMGLSTDELEYILSQEEYDRVFIRDEIEIAIECAEYERAQKMLDDYHKQDGRVQVIDEMYYYRTKAQILLEIGTGEELDRAKEYIIKALKITAEGISISNYSEYRLSTYELENVLLYAKLLCITGETIRGIGILEELYAYYIKTCKNEALLARIIPKCVYLMAEFGIGIIDDVRIVEYCEQGLYYLRKSCVLYMLYPLMRATLKCYERIDNAERIEYWKPYYELLHELYEAYGNGRNQTSLFFRWKTTSYYLDSEVIKGERLNKGMTQEELADGIYSNPASISNVEKGKSSPNKTKYNKIFEKLGIDKARFSGFVIAESFDEIEQIARIRKALSVHNYDELLKLIDEKKPGSILEEELLEAYRLTALAEKDRINVDNYSDMLKNIVEGVFSLEREECKRKLFQAEWDILVAYYAKLKEKELEDYLDVINAIWDRYVHSKVNIRYNYRIFTSISILRLKPMFVDNAVNNQYDNLASYCVDTGKGSALVGMEWNEACRLDKADPLKKKLLYKSYMFAELNMSKSASIMQDYYEKLYPPVV